MATTIAYTPSGALQITISPTACACGHAHPSAMEDWDTVIRTASKWVSDNAPVCRSFSGVEPWARGDSPVTLMVNKRPVIKKTQAPSTSEGSVTAVAMSDAASKQTRSAFGCDACKKRKIKCDESRPTCTNCCASTRKRARRCVYAYDFISRPARERVERGDSSAGSSSRDMSIDVNVEASVRPAIAPQPALEAVAGDPAPVMLDTEREPWSLTTVPFTLPQLTPQTVDAEALSLLVETHGLTWFMNATEIVEKQVLASNQRRAFTEYRQAVLERCWNAYINCHGKLPLSLPSTPSVTSAETPTGFVSAMSSMIALPGLATLPSPSISDGVSVTPQQIADLVQAALLHAFVSVGALHYSYWAGKRGEANDDHIRGGASLIQLSTNALLQVLRLQDLVSRGQLTMTLADMDDWEEEIEAKLLMTMCLALTYRICAADPLGPATLRLECEFIAKRGGPSGMVAGPNLTPAQMEIITVILNDAIYSLTRGEGTFQALDASWLDTIPIAQRLIPEGWGFSLEMAKYIIETAGALYGPRTDDRPMRLQKLYRTLTTSVLVDIYASAHPARVQTGDMLYRQALICLLSIDGLGVPPDDKRLVAASDAILELFAEAVYGDIYTVRWAMPLLIGGGLAQKLTPAQEANGDRDRRAEAERIFDAMADTCGLGDIEAARLVTEKVWERRDAGKLWRLKDTMREENLELFLV